LGVREAFDADAVRNAALATYAWLVCTIAVLDAGAASIEDSWGHRFRQAVGAEGIETLGAVEAADARVGRNVANPAAAA
jgi:hypothetical protein